MFTSELDYELPERLIAQEPARRRDDSRLLIVDRSSEILQEDVFRNLPDYLESGDCLALNDTRVIRARLQAHKSTGGQVELFLLRPVRPGEWEALVRPSARVKPGTVLTLGAGIRATVDDVIAGGARRVRFDVPDVLAALETAGQIPLPPYIHRSSPDVRDAERYQTVYARHAGAVAAPTAGLHFTPELFDLLDARGVRRACLTLHVGYGTFKPIQTERLDDHSVDPEEFALSEDAAAALNAARSERGRVIAVGTTAARVLESQFRAGVYRAGTGLTGLYIYPPYAFQGVDALITNFHLPRSSLLALVCAFAGRDKIFDAYRFAIKQEYRFYSYGDAMLIR